MAGHSHAKNIMHRKGKSDAVRSKIFSKLAREITVAAKLGMPDPAFNARLRLAVVNARSQSMPKDNIEAGADDVESDEEGHYITTTFEAMVEVAAALEKVLGEAESVKAIWKPQTNTPIDAEKGATLMKLISILEEDDDVQNVYSNEEMSDEDAAKLEA